ncbi:Hypoxia induced protein domain-containing protein [Dioscorea alata]|uniref:Hypoxia induced protein domain-containing protein n=1 Tax=Dioscorea alata TaxID=55571 RepID=A0ACB7VKE2_DIOAL|nr:Hypoxia induced protein domain-containing protein [Dioscorea alata]
MEKMGVAEPQLEDLFKQLVPIGAFVTAGVLTAGLISFRQGKSQLGQKPMRARVVTQGATVALMFGGAYYYGDQFKGLK